MTSISRLDALPEELFDDICIRLASLDLLSLRQVSRNLEALTDKRFLDTFFTSRSHVYTLHSIQTLAEIASVPRLVHHIQELTIAYVELNSAAHENLGQPMRLWTEQNQRLHADGLSAKLLARVLRAVAAGPHWQHFRITLSGTRGEQDYGTVRLMRLLGLDDLTTNSCDMHNHVRYFLKTAADVNELALTDLRIVPNGMLRPEAFICDRPLDEQVAFWNKLTSLHVEFRPVYFDISFSKLCPVLEQGFFTLLRAARRLQSLTIAGYGGWTSTSTHDGQLFTQFAASIAHLKTLQRLDLSWFDVCEQQLITLLTLKSRKSKHSRLCELTLAKDERWKDALILMATEMNLETLTLDRLRSDDEEYQDVPQRLNQLTLKVRRDVYVQWFEGDDLAGIDFDSLDEEQEFVETFSFRSYASAQRGLNMLIQDGEYRE